MMRENTMCRAISAGPSHARRGLRHHAPCLCRTELPNPAADSGFGGDGTVRDKDIQNLCNPATQKLVRIKISVYYAFKKTQPPYLDLVPMIKRLFDAFGPDRLMWASDCPYQLTAPSTYAAPIAIVRHRLDFVSADDRRKLLRTTAESKFFFTVKK